MIAIIDPVLAQSQLDLLNRRHYEKKVKEEDKSDIPKWQKTCKDALERSGYFGEDIWLPD